MSVQPRRMAQGEKLTATLYNSLLDYVRENRPLPGHGVRIDRSAGGSRISAAAETRPASRLAPFSVRWSEADACLVVYLPPGSCNLNGWTVLNAAAAHAGENWYLVHWGAQKLSTAGDVTVTAHVKPRFQVGSGSIHPVVFVDATSTTASDNTYARAGDAWSMNVATVTVEEDTSGDDAVYVRRVRQSWSGPADWLSEPVPGLLELYWRQSAALATSTASASFSPRFQAVASDRAPVCDAAFGSSTYTVTLTRSSASTKVYYVIDLTGSAPVPTVTVTAPTTDLDKKLVYWVYTLQYGRVTADRRAILAERAFYP